jgi:hypothetical protein
LATSSSSLLLAFQTQPSSLLGPSLSRSPTLLATFLGPSTFNHVSSLPTDAASLLLITGTNSSPFAKPAASFHLPFPQLLDPVGFHAPPANEPDSPPDFFSPASSPRSFPFASPARFSFFFFPRDSGCDPGHTHFSIFFSLSSTLPKRGTRLSCDVALTSPRSSLLAQHRCTQRTHSNKVKRM